MPTEMQVTFNNSMSEEDFFKWLKSRGVSDKDCKTLTGKAHWPVLATVIIAVIDYYDISFREWCYSFGIYSV